MLLRRVIQHVKSQNWFAVGIDFVIVVVGVFIGIQVSNWNTVRLEVEKQDLVETRLRADFAAISEELRDALSDMDQRIVALDKLRTSLRKGALEQQDEDDLKHALSYGIAYPSFFLQSPTYLELQSSGNLHLIENEALRVALAGYETRTFRSRFNLERIWEGINVRRPNFRRYAQLEPLNRLNNGDIPILENSEFDFEAMVADPEFLQNVEHVLELQTWINANIINSREEVKEIIVMLDAAD